MYITSLQYITLMCLSYPLLHMPNKQDITSMETTMKIEDKILDENGSDLKERLNQDCKIPGNSVATTTQSVTTTEDLVLDVCFIFLYHITSRKSAGSILATTALFFWKVSSFPVNGTASSTDHTKKTKIRKSRSVSTRHKFDKGNNCFLALFPEAENTNDQSFLSTFSESGQAKKLCFQALVPSVHVIIKEINHVIVHMLLT